MLYFFDESGCEQPGYLFSYQLSSSFCEATQGLLHWLGVWTDV